MRKTTARLPAVVRWLMVALPLLLAAAPATAQEAREPAALSLSFQDGTVHVNGRGFRPLESVVMQVQVEDVRGQTSATADEQGRFAVDSDIAVRSGQRVEVRAQGSLGTTTSIDTTASAVIQPAGPVEDAPEMTTTMFVLAVVVGVSVGLFFAGAMALSLQRRRGGGKGRSR